MRLHFLGIAGTMVCGVARLAAELGHEVSGSDSAFEPPMGGAARALNIPLFEGYDADAESRPADCYVFGNAISRGCPLAESVLSRGLPYTSAAQWLADNALAGREVFAVAGTHGKTTTASLLAWMLERAGFSPGFLLGGVPQNFGVSARLGTGKFFVVEADEYDSAFFDKRPKFMHYRPRAAVLNNLEFDHADIYNGVEEIVRQFHYLLRTVPADGAVFARAGDANIGAALAEGVYSPVFRFGEGGEWEWRFGGGEMAVLRGGRECCRFAPPLPGGANRANITAAAAAADYAGADVSKLGEYLEGFLPPLRRMQKLAESGGVLVYDDFAHHPTAYRASLAAAAELHPQKRIVAVFEPRSNTMKSGAFKKELSAAFAGASRVVGVGGYEWLPAALSPLGEKASVCADAAAAEMLLRAEMRPGDCIVCMSNGAFGGLPQKTAKAAEELPAVRPKTAAD